MAAQSNILKLLQSLGGMASESYGQGSMAPSGRVGGQPILPKPTVSMPNAMSPYAPGNQAGGPMAHIGGYANMQPNRTKGVKPNQMGEMQPSHPIAQLASYLQTQGGMAGPGGRPMAGRGVDAGAFLRGQQ